MGEHVDEQLTRLRVTLDQRRRFDAAIAAGPDGSIAPEIANASMDAMRSVSCDLTDEAAELYERLTWLHRRCTAPAITAAAYWGGAAQVKLEAHRRGRLTIAVTLPRGVDVDTGLAGVWAEVEQGLAAGVRAHLVLDVGEDALRACSVCEAPLADLGDVPNVGRCPDCGEDADAAWWKSEIPSRVDDWLIELAVTGRMPAIAPRFDVTDVRLEGDLVKYTITDHRPEEP